MGDPLSIAAGVAGLVSLGIQTVQGLVDFYSSYKSQNTTIARTTDKLEALLGTLQTINQTLANRQFRADEKDVIVKIENSIQSCEDLISELQEEYEKFSNSSASGIRAAIRGAGRKLTYPFRESTLKKLDEDIGDIRENLSLSLDVLQLRSAHDLQNDLTDIKVLVNLVRESQVSNRIREWLRAPDATESHNQACAKRHPGTGLWLVKSPKFANWLEADKSFLWLNGFAGCGKTVLSSTAIQYTFRHRRSNPRIGIAFFYFSFSDAAKQDAAGMLRTLLLQLSNQLMDGHIALNRLYSNHIGGQPPLPALMESLRQVVNSFQDVYILVDALDESPRHKKRETVLDTLRDLRGWSVPGLHILVTSRDELDIRERLDTSNDEEIPMQNTEVDKDIADFVSQHLRQDWKMQKWSVYHDKIEQALVDRAKGV
jgi:ankyrin repeat domain-containing protein 50